MSFEAIIAKVKAHPELWLSTHPFFRHRVVSARTWMEIAQELNADEMIIRKRWKHLKDQYRKEHKKLVAKIIPMTNWSYYNALHFLSDMSLSVELSDMIEIRVEGTDVQSHSDSDDAPLKAHILKKALTKSSPLRRSPQTPKVKQERGIHNIIRETPDSGKLNLILNRLIGMEQAHESGNRLVGDMSKNDSDYTFLLSLLPMMKKLTPIQKLQFRGKINDWLLNTVARNENPERTDYTIYIQDIKPPID